jgi:hypothetical protein
VSAKRKPSNVAAEAIRELSSELDGQRVLLEDIKNLLITLTDGLSEHRSHTLQAVDDLGKRVMQIETRLR